MNHKLKKDRSLTPLQLLCWKGIFEGTKLVDWTDDQVNRAAEVITEARMAKLRIKRISTSDPDRTLLKAEIHEQVKEYVWRKINAEFKKIKVPK